MSSNAKALNGLQTVRRKYARKKNVADAVKSLKKDKDGNVKFLLEQYDGTAKELLKAVKKIKKGVSSKEAIQKLLPNPVDEIQSEASDSFDDDPVIDIELPANIECDEPKDPSKKSIVVMNQDGLVGCGVIKKNLLME